MKKIDWKILILTCIICVLPVIAGAVVYDKLPETMAVHFNVNNEPNGFASKDFALFGLPGLMIAMQIFCCVISDINEEKKGNKPKFISIVKWVIPVLTILVSTLTIQIGLGSTVDVRKAVMLFLGILYIILGNYMPKVSYDQMQGKMHPMPKDDKGYRKMVRLMGYTFVIFGFLSLASIFLGAMASCIIIVAMIVVLLVETIWVLVKNREKN